MDSKLEIIKRDDTFIYVIKFGNVNISLNAFIIIICGFILCIIMTYLNKIRYDITIVPFFISLIVAYNINCVEVGKCGTWSWILTCLYLINVCIIIYISYNKEINPIAFNTKIQYIQSKLNRLLNIK